MANLRCIDGGAQPASLHPNLTNPLHLTDHLCNSKDVHHWHCKQGSVAELGSNLHPLVEHIPRIVHQTWKTCSPPDTQTFYRLECAQRHPGWTFNLWTDRGNKNLIKREFPKFLSTYQAYTHPIMRVDAVRLFYIYVYGGIYMDTDMACLRNLDALIEGAYQFVAANANSEKQGSNPVVPNAFFAAPPRHPFTAFLISRLMTVARYTKSIFATAGPAFFAAAYTAWTKAGGAGVHLLPQNSVYSDSNVSPQELNALSRQMCALASARAYQREC